MNKNLFLRMGLYSLALFMTLALVAMVFWAIRVPTALTSDDWASGLGMASDATPKVQERKLPPLRLLEPLSEKRLQGEVVEIIPPKQPTKRPTPKRPVAPLQIGLVATFIGDTFRSALILRSDKQHVLVEEGERIQDPKTDALMVEVASDHVILSQQDRHVTLNLPSK